MSNTDKYFASMEKFFGSDREASIAYVLAGLLVLFYLALSLTTAGWRDLAGYGTETDFVGGMVYEARRVLSGEPLASEFHPPGYPIALVAAYQFSGDWFTAGKMLSVLSGAVVLIVMHQFFRLLCGPWVALGAVIGLLCSSTFLSFSIQSVSDVYYLALFCMTSLAACAGALRRRYSLWLLTGLLAGLSLMTRTNGITQLLLLAIPLFQPQGEGYRLRAVAAGLLGVVAMIVCFLLFAYFTDSNLFPAGTASNLAMNYFAEESKISWEGVLEVRERFPTLSSVLLHDPRALIGGYAKDMYSLFVRNAPALSGPLLALLFLPGFLFLCGDQSRIVFFLLLLVNVAQIGLVNFKAFEPRYYLFLTPWIGAATVHLAVRLARNDWPKLSRMAILTVVGSMILASLGLSVVKTVQFARHPNPELSDAMPAVQEHISSDDAIISRKPHISYYSGAESVWIPKTDDLEEIRALLASTAARIEGTVFLFYGDIERDKRPELEPLLRDGSRPDWLLDVAKGSGSQPWVLYKYAPEKVGG